MTTTLKNILLLNILLITSCICYGQQQDIKKLPDTLSVTRTKKAKKNMPETFKRNNRFKINLYSLLLKNYSFTYERMLSRKISFQASYRYQPYTDITNNVLGKYLDKRNAIDFKYLNFQTANNALTADLRLYFSKRKPGRGAYVGIYGRYLEMDIDNTEYKFINNAGVVYDVPLIGNVKGFAGGFAVGWQFLIKRRVIVDYCFLGGHYGRISGTVVSNKDLSALSSDEQARLKSKIEDLYTLTNSKYLSASVTDQGVHGKISGPLYGIRTSLSVGIAF